MKKTVKSSLAIILAAVCLVTMAVGAFAVDTSAFNVSGISVSGGDKVNSNVTDWVVGANTATVNGSSFWGILPRSSGELTFTANSSGTIAFDFTLEGNSSITINSQSYANSGSYSSLLQSGDTVAIVATFNDSGNKEVSLNNITFTTTPATFVSTTVSDNGDLASAISSVSGDNVIGTVYVRGAVTVSSDLVIPANVTVVVAYDADDIGERVASLKHNGGLSGDNNRYYGKITVASDASLTVYGTLNISGKQQSTQPESGYLSGDYGMLELNGPMSIENGGSLIARGKVKGSGTITAERGSTVSQLFQIADWRGGTGASYAYYNGIFPFSRYEIISITTPTIYKNGSALVGEYYIYADSTDFFGDITLIGNDGMMIFSDSTASDDNIEFSYSTVDDETIVNVAVNGNIKTGNIAFVLAGVPIRSDDLILPFGYNMNVNIGKNAGITIYNMLKLIPGCKLTVGDNAVLTIENGGALYVYDAESYSSTYSFNYNWDPSDDAELIQDDNATVTIITGGVIATSDSACANLDELSIPDPDDIVYVKEFSNNSTATNVIFYKAA